MNEHEVLDMIRASATQTAPAAGVAVGPGDDCAALSNGLLVTTDQLIAGRHFEPKEDLDLIARKAVARSVSDIAAMGGRPTWSVATGAIPSGTSTEYVKALCRAMHRWAEQWGCPMVGGDLATIEGPLVITVTVGGSAHPKRGPVLRSAACIGDRVYITGRLGGSLPSRRHLTFEPRIQEGWWLASTLGSSLHAMMDLSDGLGIDLARIAATSGVGIEIKSRLLPRNDGYDWRHAMSDGEDYELAFTVAAHEPVPDRCPITGTPITCVGRVISGEGCWVIDGTTKHDARGMGWAHR